MKKLLLKLLFVLLISFTLHDSLLVQNSKEWLGVRYKYGGTTKKGVDCSGFVQNVYKETYNIDLPRTSKLQFKATKAIKKEDLKEGDLIFFAKKGKIFHVGLYLNDDKFIHASVSKGVIISSLEETYYKKIFYKGTRVETV